MDKAIVFFGWSFRLFLSGGCLKSNGVILIDIVERLGTTNSVVGWIFSLQHAVSYLVGPLASLLLGVFTKRQMAVFGGLLVGASYIYCGLFLESVWQLFFAYTVAALIISIMSPNELGSGIGLGFHMFAGYLNFCEHFYDNLGTAVSVASLCNFLGLATLPLLLQYLKMSFGLDNGLVLFGDVLFNLVVSAFAVTKPIRNLPRFHTDDSKEQNEVEPCPYAKDEAEVQTDNVKSKKSSLQKHFQTWCAIFKHENIAIVMALEGLMFYLLVSWGLFLVSVGNSAGLGPDQAVLLSSSGGIGGIFGKLMAVALFRAEKMNAITSTFIPLLCNAACLMGCALLKSFYMMLLLTFICGACIGVNSSGLFGLLPTTVCKAHFHGAFVTCAFVEGIAMQLAGFISGLISDTTGSAANVFVFNALLSIFGLPLVLKWASRSSE